MDVKTTFLNGMIEEEIYVHQSRVFKIHGRDTYICRLKKALYGFNLVTWACYARMDESLSKLGFVKTSADSNLYFLIEKSDLFVLVLYVDDLIITTDNSNVLILWCKVRIG